MPKLHRLYKRDGKQSENDCATIGDKKYRDLQEAGQTAQLKLQVGTRSTTCWRSGARKVSTIWSKNVPENALRWQETCDCNVSVRRRAISAQAMRCTVQQKRRQPMLKHDNASRALSHNQSLQPERRL